MVLIIIFAVLLLTAIGVIAFMTTQKGIGVIFSNPIVIGLVFFTIIHFLLPMMQVSSTYYRYQTDYNFSTLFIVLILVLFGQVIFILFFSSFKIDYFKLFNNIKVSDKEIKRILAVNFIVFLIGAIMIYKNASIILSIGVTEYLRDRSSFGQGKAIQLLLAHWIYISAFIYIFTYFITKTKKLKRRALFLGLLAFGLSVFYYMINSNRNSLFIVFILIGAIWIIRNQSLNTKLNSKQAKRLLSITLLGTLAFILFFNIGKERYALYSKHKKDFKYSTVKSLNGAFGNNENILWLYENGHPLYYGQTYVAGFTNFVPRSLWANKPLGAGPKIKSLIYPDSYVLGKAKNSSLTTGLFTELQMNFGILGMIIFPAIFAIVMGFILRVMNKSGFLIVKMLSFFTGVVFFTQIYHAEFLGFFSRYIISIIPFMLIYIAGKFKLGTYKPQNLNKAIS